MTQHAFPRHALRTGLAAALLLAAAVAQAATGFTVTAAQEKQIKPGMSRDAVRAALGRPAHNVKYRAEPGRTWTYGVKGKTDMVFDIDFDASGQVLSTSERSELID
jgi:outer membrane protein assembly factor BamE (lipoprotein component of BamABCDE complex)